MMRACHTHKNQNNLSKVMTLNHVFKIRLDTFLMFKGAKICKTVMFTYKTYSICVGTKQTKQMSI